MTSSFSVVQDLFIYNVQAEYFFYFFNSPIFGTPAVLRLVCIRMVMLLFTLKTFCFGVYLLLMHASDYIWKGC